MAAKSRDRLLDRKASAKLVSEEYFPCSKRALERWPIAGKLVNGRVHLSEREVRKLAQARIDAAPATTPPSPRKDR